MNAQDVTNFSDKTFFLLIILGATWLLGQEIRARYIRNPRRLPLPPGPKGLPLIGNLLNRPTDRTWLVYRDWAKIYGDMFYFEVLGQSFLVLNSLDRTHDLFDRRSVNYSDRLQQPMLVDLMGFSFNLAFMPYGPWWRRHRRSFNEYFHRNAVSQYQPVQARQTREFLSQLSSTPEDFFQHIRHTFGATIMKVAYGIDVKDSDDPHITRAEHCLNGLSEAGVPGTFLVDFIPALKYIPSWFPGASFKRKALMWRRFNKEVPEVPFKYVEEQLKSGKAVPCISTAMIERLPDTNDALRDEEKTVAKGAAALAYIGGADTTVSSVQSFFLAMALYPEVQKRAQAELDRVVGPKGLPEFSDRDDLPYINALVKETMRWHLVTPLGVPHTSTSDDEYDGYFIPKGTIVIGNSWSILHDPAVFADPEEYRPERYLKNGKLDPNVRDPNTAAFGFGRRMCPGRHFSDNSLYIIIASVLAVYNIRPPLDEHGKTIKLEPRFTDGLLTYPLPFKCNITPRSPSAEALISKCLDSVDTEQL